MAIFFFLPVRMTLRRRPLSPYALLYLNQLLICTYCMEELFPSCHIIRWLLISLYFNQYSNRTNHQSIKLYQTYLSGSDMYLSRVCWCALSAGLPLTYVLRMLAG